MNIQKDLEKYVAKIKGNKDHDLCDLCLCLVCLNQLKKVIQDFDDSKLESAIEYSHKIKRNDITAMLRILQELSILKSS